MVDWDTPSIVKHADQSRSSKSDFAIKLVAMMEAAENTGYLADVQRAINGKRKYVVCVLTRKMFCVPKLILCLAGSGTALLFL